MWPSTRQTRCYGCGCFFPIPRKSPVALVAFLTALPVFCFAVPRAPVVCRSAVATPSTPSLRPLTVARTGISSGRKSTSRPSPWASACRTGAGKREAHFSEKFQLGESTQTAPLSGTPGSPMFKTVPAGKGRNGSWQRSPPQPLRHASWVKKVACLPWDTHAVTPVLSDLRVSALAPCERSQTVSWCAEAIQ